MKRTKTLFFLILVLTLVLGLSPAGAILAQEETPDAKAAMTDQASGEANPEETAESEQAKGAPAATEATAEAETAPEEPKKPEEPPRIPSEPGPRILASGLSPMMEVEQPELRVGFLFSSEHPITRVEIQGASQEILPGTLVLLPHEFLLRKGDNQILVKIQDEKGQEAMARYRVWYSPPYQFLPKEGEEILQGYDYSLRLAQDSNPSLDIAAKSGSIEGLLGTDREPDQRMDLAASMDFKLFGLEGSLGYQGSRYLNLHTDLNKDRIYVGAFQTIERQGGAAWLWGLSFFDDNQQGKDLSQHTRLSLGRRYVSENAAGDKRFLMMGLHYSLIDFASLWRQDGNELKFTWDLKTISKDRGNESHTILSLGNRTEGVAFLDHNYLNASFRFLERIDEDFSGEAGIGFEYREYSGPQNNLGTEIPVDVSLRLLWQATKELKVDLFGSNIYNFGDQATYRRNLVGLGILGEL